MCGVSNAKVKEYFIIPTIIVDRELKKSNELYHKGQKKDGSKRKITSHRALFLQGDNSKSYWYGWREVWKKYYNNWSLLEK